jgi:2Fe-2S ferredoxin
MPIVRIEPVGTDLEVPDGDTLMGAAQAAGYHWPSVCGGFAICGACAVQVRVGADHAAVPAELEARRLSEVCLHRSADGGAVRLACQLVPLGAMTVFKIGVRRRPQ